MTLCNMLKNEVYIGNTVQNKRSIISYKVKKFRTIDKEEHIRVENTRLKEENAILRQKMDAVLTFIKDHKTEDGGKEISDK